MFLKSLKLANFRNYSKLELNFTHPITILIGNNAQGKSNFLEAIYFLATSKSPKADEDLELIKQGENFLRVEGTLDKKIDLEVVMQTTSETQIKKVKVNGIARRVFDYTQNLVVVQFSPEDINLVTGSPSSRRRHLDQLLSQVDRNYKKTISQYEETLIRKNKLLKAIREGQARVDELDFWINEQLKFAQIITDKRTEFFRFLNSAEKKFGPFTFNYQLSIINYQLIKEYQTKEIAAAASLIGPHRDDFVFLLGEHNLSKFGSRGEQRTAVLDLKISEVNFIEQKLGSRPVMLLDDIFSELDQVHQDHVASLAKLQQTIIAAIELDSYLKNKFGEKAEVIKIIKGKLAN